jgi:hypothetical protein
MNDSQVAEVLNAVLWSSRACDGEGANVVEALLEIAEAVNRLAATIEYGPALSISGDINAYTYRGRAR